MQHLQNYLTKTMNITNNIIFRLIYSRCLLLIININLKGVINMNTFKKIGLTALAGSLVVTSAYAGAVSVAGGASMGVKNNKGNQGKSWTMGNQLTFTGSGELDNGMNVSISFVLDQADDSTTTGTAHNGTSPFDSHSVTVSSDAMGSLTMHGEGGSSAQAALDTTAGGDLWDNGFSAGTPEASAGAGGMLVYTLPSVMDDLTLKASYTAGGAGKGSAMAYSLSYAGVEGLTLDYGMGETETVAATADTTTIRASYAYGSFTGTYVVTDHDDVVASEDEEVTSYKLSYTVNDDISVSYSQETHDDEGSTIDEEVDSINVSYTSGGMTLSAAQINADNVGNSNDASADKERWTVSASFAF